MSVLPGHQGCSNKTCGSLETPLQGPLTLPCTKMLYLLFTQKQIS